MQGDLWRLRAMTAPGGWMYRNAHYLVAELALELQRASRWVPWPLRLARPGLATLFTAWFPETSFGSTYREAGLFFHVEHRGRPALYSPWMLVDDDVALITGRELLGYPKKLGEIEFAVDLAGGTVRAVARRRGVELVRMEGRLGAALASPPPMLGRPHRNVRASLGLAIPTLVAFTPRERTIEARSVELALRLGSSERDPLAELGLGALQTARLHRVDLAAGGLPLPCAAVSPLGFLRSLLLRSH